VRRADNLTTFMCRLSKNLGASTSWSPKDLSRPVMGLLCFNSNNSLTVSSDGATAVTMNDNVFWDVTSCILTQRNINLLQKLSVPQLVMQIPAFYRTRRFITVFTTAYYFSLSRARLIQSTLPSYFLTIHFNIILPLIPRSSKWYIFFRFAV
jgi:hypothetical protein